MKSWASLIISSSLLAHCSVEVEKSRNNWLVFVTNMVAKNCCPDKQIEYFPDLCVWKVAMGLNVDCGQYANGMFPCWWRYFEIQSKSWLLKYGRDILKPLCSWIIFDCMPYLILRQLLQFLDAGMTVLGKMHLGECSLENCRSLWYFFVSNIFLRKFWSVNEIYFHWIFKLNTTIFLFYFWFSAISSNNYHTMICDQQCWTTPGNWSKLEREASLKLRDCDDTPTLWLLPQHKYINFYSSFEENCRQNS